jgi:tetratricopeptide (TPR) repeat protein
VSRATQLIAVDEAALTTPRSFEANAWKAFYDRKWEDALRGARCWFADQSFSGRAAVLATYIASVPLGRHQEALEIARAAVQANPDDVMLLNNYAFSLASTESVHEARLVFQRIPREHVNEPTRVILTATEGLLEFRSGNHQRGRELYAEAKELAQSVGTAKHVALAAAYLAREEARVGSASAAGAMATARELAGRADCEEARLILGAVESADRNGPP